MTATDGIDEVQVTVGVMSFVVPSVYVPVAANCCEVPSGMAGFRGVIAIETRLAAVTVRLPEPLTDPDAAVIVTAPEARALARPWLPTVLLTVATVPSEELQCAVAVTSCVLLSLNVPVAVNCWVVPKGMEAFAGATVMATSAAALTVNVVAPLVLPEVALIVVVPWVRLVAKPVMLMVATPVGLELQVTEFVRSCVLLSLNVPVAVNCCFVPRAIELFAGAKSIDTRATGPTVRTVDPITEPIVAEIVVFPAANVWARPALPMVATALSEEPQDTELVRFCVL